MNCTRFRNNSAGLHSPTIATFATNVTLEFDNTTVSFANETILNVTDGTTYNKTLVVIPSGQPVNITATLYDDHGNKLSNENLAKAQLTLVPKEVSARRLQDGPVPKTVVPKLLNNVV